MPPDIQGKLVWCFLEGAEGHYTVMFLLLLPVRYVARTMLRTPPGVTPSATLPPPTTPPTPLAAATPALLPAPTEWA